MDNKTILATGAADKQVVRLHDSYFKRLQSETFTRKPDSPAALELKRLGAELAAGTSPEGN